MKKLTAKQARKISKDSYDIEYTLEGIETTLCIYTALGFTNMNIDISSDISKKLVPDLKKRGFKVYTKEVDGKVELEVEW